MSDNDGPSRLLASLTFSSPAMSFKLQLPGVRRPRLTQQTTQHQQHVVGERVPSLEQGAHAARPPIHWLILLHVVHAGHKQRLQGLCVRSPGCPPGQLQLCAKGHGIIAFTGRLEVRPGACHFPVLTAAEAVDHCHENGDGVQVGRGLLPSNVAAEAVLDAQALLQMPQGSEVAVCDLLMPATVSSQRSLHPTHQSHDVLRVKLDGHVRQPRLTSG